MKADVGNMIVTCFSNFLLCWYYLVHIFEDKWATKFSHDVSGRKSFALLSVGGTYLIWMSLYSIISCSFDFLFSGWQICIRGCMCVCACACVNEDKQ